MKQSRHLPRWLALAMLFTASLGHLAAGGLAAQQPPPRFEEELVVTEVLLDVLVTDRRGNVVVGLGPQDFVVTEDGEPVEVTAATFYSNRELLESPEVVERLGVPVDTVQVDRYFVLFLHDPRPQMPRVIGQLMDAARWTRQWVQGSLTPNDHVAVVSYDVRLKVQQDFTTEHRAVAAALDDAVVGRVPSPAARAAGDGSPSLLAELPTDSVLRSRTATLYGGMEQLSRALAAIPGRKNVLLFSMGFGEIDSLGFFVPDTRYYPPMVESLNAANVAIYSVDLIPTSAPGSLRHHVLGNSLSTLSMDTGGVYYFNFVSFISPLERIAEDNSGYYLLSYLARHPRAASGFQRVRVESRNPELVLRARQGYRYGPE
jgi:VWFA-related protein